MAKKAKTASQSTAANPVQKQAEINIDDKDMKSCYANFCRVLGTPEELLVDFGLNSRPMESTAGPIEVNQRIVMNFYTAKRLVNALNVALQRHESVFGAVETNINKRVAKKEGDSAS